MDLQLLPTRTGSAAENMAVDYLLLRHYPDAAHVRFRHYNWRRPALTFGYSQKIAAVRTLLPADGAEICRRPTGGGLVDHREDWTYTLVIPRGHPWEEMRAALSYRAAHEALATALARQGVPATVKTDCEPSASGQSGGASGVCFQRAELYDVVRADSGAKIAGAAQKRTKQGLLFQGSIWRPAAGGRVNWEDFHEAFTGELASRLGCTAVATPWPEFADEELESLTEQYASPEWLEYR